MILFENKLFIKKNLISIKKIIYFLKKNVQQCFEKSPKYS